jgi:radical SAM superfamily enzyme YgiQ (UPF0313 family)
MANVCLVRPLLSPTDFNGYPLNLLILAAALRESRHTVAIRDYDYLKEIDATWGTPDFARRAAAEIVSGAPAYVGITSMCSNYVLALDLAKQIKARSPSTHVTFGGPHVSLCAQETIARHEYVDTAVIGEGEVTYPDLIDALESGRSLFSVPGIAFRQHQQPIQTSPRQLLADLNESPRAAYDLVDVRAYVAASRSTYLEIYAGSGCPFQCTFCSTSIVWQRKYRTMSAARIVSEMAHLNETYGVEAFSLIHDNLSSNRTFIGEIAAAIHRRGLPIRWGFSSRIDTLDSDTVARVAASGCDYIFFGIETGSARIQATMKKKLKLETIYATLECCMTHGIRPTTSFILGFPDETAEDVASTVRLAFKCKVAGSRRSFINLLSPYTGTPVMRDYAEGLTLEPSSMNSTMISYLTERHLDMIRGDPFIFANYYSLPYSHSTLSAAEYGDLVDFFTIALMRYPFTVSYLLNDRQVDPVELFRDFSSTMRRMSHVDRNALALTLRLGDLRPYVSPDYYDELASVFCFDMSLHLVSTADTTSVLYSGRIRPGLTGLDGTLTGVETRHYLHNLRGDAVHTTEISDDLSQLYELQGLPAIRSESYQG